MCRHGFGIWSLRWAADGREVIAGTGDHSLYVFDLERQKVRPLSQKGLHKQGLLN